MLFAVIRTSGDAWDPSRSMEGQSRWGTHAAFMNGLEIEGFVVLRGPFEATPDIRRIVRATHQSKLKSDCAAIHGHAGIFFVSAESRNGRFGWVLSQPRSFCGLAGPFEARRASPGFANLGCNGFSCKRM